MNLFNGNNEDKRRALVVNNQKMSPEELNALLEAQQDGENVPAVENDPTLIERWEAHSDCSSVPVNTQPQVFNRRWEKPGVTQLSPVRFRTIIGTMAGIAIAGTAGTILSQVHTTIERVISVTGQLKTQKTVQEIQAPFNLVVKEIYVNNGERVEKGQSLVRFDAKNSYAQLQSLEGNRQSLMQQNRFYETVIKELIDKDRVETKIVSLKLAKEAAFLIRNRIALLEANHLLQVQLKAYATNINGDNQSLAPQSNSSASSQSHIAQVNLAVEKLQKQLQQNQVRLQSAQRNLKLEQTNLAKIQLLVKEGAISRLEYAQQQQKVQFQEVEVERLHLEQQHLTFSIEQIKEQLANLTAVDNQQAIAAPISYYQKQITNNQKQIAEIDSQLTKIIAENERQITALDRQISRTKKASTYPILRAPAAGTVFDLQAAPGSISQPMSTKALLKLMSDEQHLIAEVFIPQENIDSLWEGMEVNVKIDSFSLSEHEYIDGQLVAIGSDALPPDKNYPFYRLPAKVSLEQQALVINDKEIPFQSGMPVTINMKVRETPTLLEAILQKLGL
ncbi:MAG: HlyD family efflux transporter periplasmic adaptor subunit [Microcystaceae cyanobacterium]